MRSRVHANIERPSVRPSVYLSVPYARRTPLRRVCCCGPGGQEISIDCCATGGRQQLRRSSDVCWANAGSATLLADARSRTLTCFGFIKLSCNYRTTVQLNMHTFYPATFCCEIKTRVAGLHAIVKNVNVRPNEFGL